jgi:hypothetical protein
VGSKIEEKIERSKEKTGRQKKTIGRKRRGHEEYRREEDMKNTGEKRT